MPDNDTLNEIFYHASEGSVDNFLKKYPQSLQHVDFRGRNALAYAAMTDNLKNVQIIVKKGVSFWDCDHTGATPLHWAVQGGSTKVIRQILQSGKPPSGISPVLMADKEGVTPLHIAARRGSDKILKILIEYVSPTDDVFKNAVDIKGRSPLHYAATACSYECTKLIIDSDTLGLPVDQKDQFGLTPLMCAVGVKLPQALEVVRLLANRKKISVSTRNRDGQTALHLAVAADNQPVIDALLKNMPSVEVFDNEFRTPLHYAADFGNDEAVERLLKAGAKNITRDRYNVTPAHYAAQNSTKALSLLLQTEKSTNKIKDVKDSEQRSCFMWAVVAGNVDAIDFLLSHGAVDRQEQDNRGFTALHLAAMVGNERVCKILHKQGWNLNERDKNEATAMHLAAGRGHTDVVRFLLTAGANMNEKDSLNRTPIFSACFGGQAHTLYVMIKELCFEWRTFDPACSSSRVPVTDALGRTPLHAAAYAGFSHCITQLLKIEEEDDYSLKSALVGWADRTGETALHVACYRGRLDCVLVLLRGGAALNAVDDENKTPLDKAIEAHHKTIADHLMSQNALTIVQLRDAAAKVIQKGFRRRLEERKESGSRRKVKLYPIVFAYMERVGRPIQASVFRP